MLLYSSVLHIDLIPTIWYPLFFCDSRITWLRYLYWFTCAL